MTVFWEFLLDRLSQIGDIPLCNGRADTTFHLFGFCFILCYRCTFIFIGLLSSILFLNKNQYFKTVSIKYRIILIVGLISLTLIDGVRQYFFGIMSNNFLRISTGFLAGIGFGVFVDTTIEYLSEKMNKKYNDNKP